MLHCHLSGTVRCLSRGPGAVYVISNKGKPGRPFPRTRNVTSCLGRRNVTRRHVLRRPRSGAARRGVIGDGGLVDSSGTSMKIVAGGFRVFHTLRVTSGCNLSGTRNVTTNSPPGVLIGGVIHRFFTRVGFLLWLVFQRSLSYPIWKYQGQVQGGLENKVPCKFRPSAL